ncbi:MAG TPA: sugar phosphate nucleotidyltransferase [Oligoflexia bacterium]|nr:sugar phosphate nucleotidyltransferase [Oligoflexia bacterium]HMP47363.1 sugar phosphate nucleotidyltransferase [Oligoflexia bacterium]
MEAFLLAAGLGTRLRPLTENLPKPLIDVAGKPLIEWNLQLLSMIGISRVVINTHYLHDKLNKYIRDNKNKWNLEIIISHEPELLDTGGGLKQALTKLQSDNIIIWNSDIILDPVFIGGLSGSNSESEFSRFLKLSNDTDKQASVTILTRNTSQKEMEQFGSLGLSADGRVVEFLGIKYGKEDIFERVIFLGISIIKREISHFFPKNTKVFSSTRDIYPQILQKYADKKSGGIWATKLTSYWNDVGTIERLEDASKYMREISRLA